MAWVFRPKALFMREEDEERKFLCVFFGRR